MQEKTFLFVIFYSFAAIIFIKYFKIKEKARKMSIAYCTCTNLTTKTTLNGNLYLYYYIFIKNKKEILVIDKIKRFNMFFKPTIGKKYKIYVDEKNIISPYQIYLTKIMFVSIIISLILPLLFY